jgi:two-component system sensor histidine kinase CpxA
VNTLFVKTLLWFIGTAALTIAAVILAAAWNVDPEGPGPGRGPGSPPGGGPRQAFGAMVVLIQMVEARHAYETGGPAVLRATLERFRRITGAEGVLTDAEVRDLVTGRERTDLMPILTRPPRRSRSEDPPRFRLPGFLRLQPPAIARRSEDGHYIYFLLFRQRTFLSWFLQPEIHIAVLTIVAGLCWAFARHLTNPVRQLQLAVQNFGQGDLSARVRSERKDELGQLARTFDTMAGRMATLLGAERRLLQDISHELRSPLARLNVAIELARSGENPEAYLDRVQKEADRLNSLVGELLQMTRAEGDVSAMRLQPVRVDELLRDIVADVLIEAQQRGCQVQTTDLPKFEVQADPELLRRAFENVIRNGVRYTPPGTAVEVKLDTSDRTAVVTIRDHGAGVPEDSLARIFDPFFRVETDRDRSSGGVGLGLSIAKRAIELHHGHISAENANPGLRVEIQL